MNNHPHLPVVSSGNRSAFKIALLYLLIGSLWILFSDQLAAKIAPDQGALTLISIYKGWGYVVVTALLLYWLIGRDNVRRAQAEKRLHDSEQNYQVLLDQASDGIFVADAQGQYTLVNKEACRLLGYTKEELLSMNLRELIAPEDLLINPPRLDELHNGKTLITERILLRKDGSRILCEISAKLLADRRYQSIIRDITERKATEDALKRSEKRYRSLFKNMTNGFARCQMLYDENDNPKDFIYLDVNETFENLTELGNVLGRRVSEVIPGIRESNPEVFEIYGRVALTGEPEKFETYVPGLGSGIWFSVSAYSSEKGFFVAVFEVITERKQAEEKLIASEIRYRRLFESAKDGILILDADTGMIVDVNPFLTKLLGYSHDVFLGKMIWELGFFKDIAANKENFLELQAQEYIRYEDLPLETAHGQRINVEFVSNVYLVDHHKVIQCNIRDITERKRAEEELKRSNAELEQFAYVASHDLQEPLRAVAGMVQLLGERYQGKLDERADEYIGHAVDASTRMQKLINDLLDYSRVSRFGKPFATTNLENCLINALANLQLSIQESNTQITHDPLPTLMADATQMTQVLQNLIGNAIKFRGERPPHIHIGAKKIGQAWQFEVRDNGIGIEPQYYERIFLVFQHLHTRREYPGTGIGLSLCKKIIERHGGQVWVESELGQGSTFYFTIPNGR